MEEESAVYSIYNCKTVGEIPDGLICRVCMDLMCAPVSMQCGHSGCKECLEKIRCSPPQYRHCPICKESHHFNSTALTVNVSLQQLIFGLHVKCAETACEWQGTLEAGKTHKNNCRFVKLSCSFEGCRFHSERWEVEEHQIECPKKKLPCSRCGLLVKEQEAEEHLEICPCVERNCQYGCGLKFQRAHMTMHFCSCQKIAKACHVPGCFNKIKKEAMAMHNTNYGEAHHKAMQAENAGLLMAIMKKDTKPDEVTANEKMIFSFRWKLHDVTPQATDPSLPMASPVFAGPEGTRWRGILMCTPQYKLYVQLVAAAQPIAVKIKFIVMSDGAAVHSHYSKNLERLKEGQAHGLMINADIANVLNNRSLEIKFWITLVDLKY